MSIRTLARFGAPAAAAGLITLFAVSPASAHVTGTPSVANAGSYTILTMSVPHGCEGSPTTGIEIQIPEQVLSVTPTRNPLYDVETTIEQLDEPTTDAHGNEITERVGSVVYTAKTPLPDGQRDTMELSFQVPDVAGEWLWFPTIQTCEKGETGWTEVPADGQDAEELELPAPGFEVLPAAEGGDHGHSDEAEESDGDHASTEESSDDGAATEDAADSGSTAETADESDSNALGWAGLVAGLLGLGAGVTALVRSRSSAS